MRGIQPWDKETSIVANTPIKYRFNPENESFEHWQKRSSRKLKQLIGFDKLEKCDLDFEEEYIKEYDDRFEIRFSFQSEINYYVPCIMSIPKKSQFKKPPVMICLQGHGTGMHVSLGIKKYDSDRSKEDNGDRDFAVQCIEKGYCAVALEQRNFGERGGDPRPNCHEPSMTALLTGRTTIACRVWDVMKLIDTLSKYYSKKVDCKSIYCMGNSGGGTTTIYVTALEKRIKGAIPSCSFCTFLNSISEKHHCTCNYIPNIRNYFDMAEIAGLIAPRPLVIVNGREDGIFPVDPATYEFNRLKNEYYAYSSKPENVKHVIGDEGHRFYKNPSWDVFEDLIKE